MNRSRHLWGAVGAIALVTAALTACGAGGDTPADNGGGQEDAGTLHLYNFVEPTTWDPAGTAEGPFLPYALAVYDSLLVLDTEGQVAPKLATSWEYNEDLTALTLELVEGVEFSDGAPFDGEAVKANIEHFQEYATPIGPVLEGVENVTVTDANTVVLELSAPNPGLLTILTTAAGLMGSPEALGTDDIAQEPVGTGPYLLDTGRSVPGSQYTFTRKDEYWDQHYPYSEVTYAVFPDETARLNALKSGQIDYAHTSTASAARDAEGSGMTIQESAATWEGLFFFDRDGVMLEPLKDKRVREALRMAIDVDAMIKTIRGGFGEPTTQIFAPHQDAYVPELDDAYPYDPERARELLEEAGYGDGFTIPFPRTGSILPEIYTAITQYWGEIGITTEDKQWAPGEASRSIQAGDYSLVYFSNLQNLDAWAVVQLSVAPDAQYNPFHSETPELTALIDTLQTSTEETRAAAAQAVNTYLVDESWYGPMYRPALFYLTAPTVDLTVYAGYVQPPIWAFQPAS